MLKIMEGDLSRLEVPDVLSFLNLGRRTGVLSLEKSDQETKLFLREGNPVYATSTKDDLRLGRMLVRMGKVTADAVDRALMKPRSGRWRIGHVFLAEKMVQESELASFLKVQVSEVIFDTFAWKTGAFSFWDGVPPPATAVTLEMDLQNLLMEGSRRMDERGRLSEVFPNTAMVPEAMANPERVKGSVTMTPDEWKVYFLVDGRRTIAEICKLVANPDEQSTLEILHRLVNANLVAIVDSPTPSLMQAVEASAFGTYKMVDGKPVIPSAKVAVEFQPPAIRPPASEDDTKEIVTKKAVQYAEHQPKVVSSRMVLVGQEGETSFPLTKDAYTVGRHRNNDIVISDPKVSSFHARIDRTPDGFVLVDLKSRNGCFVNSKRVESSILKTGDEVRMGTARLLYKVDYTASVG